MLSNNRKKIYSKKIEIENQGCKEEFWILVHFNIFFGSINRVFFIVIDSKVALSGTISIPLQPQIFTKFTNNLC